ncbi:hypothetical protein ABKV19_020388 [Rosa sericea]
MGPRSAGNPPPYSSAPPRPPDLDEVRRKRIQIAKEQVAERTAAWRRELEKTMASFQSELLNELRGFRLELTAQVMEPSVPTSSVPIISLPVTQPVSSGLQLGTIDCYKPPPPPPATADPYPYGYELHQPPPPPPRPSVTVHKLSESPSPAHMRYTYQKQQHFSLNDDCGALSPVSVAKLTGIDEKVDTGEGGSLDKRADVNSGDGREFNELGSVTVMQNTVKQDEQGPSLCGKRIEHHALYMFDKMLQSDGIGNAGRAIIAPMSIRDKGGGLTTHREVVDASDEMAICSVSAQQDDGVFAEDKKQVSGSVTYNGHDMHEFVPQRSDAYISQHDVHIGEMIVAETLAFSARCQGAGTRCEMLEELSKREKEARIKPDIDLDIHMKGIASESQRAVFVSSYSLKILGLDGCGDTMVRDQMIRGISGGQKKRITTGEMLVGPAKALFMDEISTGLDSSTTFQIVNSIKQSVHILQGTAFISLLQPAPETYNIFDDIFLLSDGQIVYQDPREYVLDFFKSIGFRCPERKGVADFLQEVTSEKDQEQYWGSRDEPYRFITVEEFSEAFQSFHVGGTITNELATPFDKTKSHPAALSTNIYGVKKAELVKACLSREFLLMKRNSFVYLFKLTQQSILALTTMTLFLRTKMHHDTVINGGLYVGALFFSLYTVVLNAVAEISMTVAKLPVFYKQRKLLFFPPWAYALPTWILKIPLTCVEVGVWVFISYYVIGYDPNVGRLIKQYLLLLLMHQMANALFKFIAGTGRSLTIANTLASFATCIYVALGGFILSRGNIKKWWKWGYWISPLMYGQNAIVVNEFLGKSWRHEIPNSTESLGIAVLKSRGFRTHAYWYWIGAGALAGYMLFFNICYTLALTYLNPLDKPQDVKSEESQGNKDDDKSLTPQISKEKGDGSTTHNTKRGMVLLFEPYSITFDENLNRTLKLPSSARVHPVFHVSLLKKKIGDSAVVSGHLPPDIDPHNPRWYPAKILDRKLFKKGNEPVTKWLIQWLGTTEEEATWEESEEILQRFPDFQA